jgi:hypothetical protein
MRWLGTGPNKTRKRSLSNASGADHLELPVLAAVAPPPPTPKPVYASDTLWPCRRRSKVRDVSNPVCACRTGGDVWCGHCAALLRGTLVTGSVSCQADRSMLACVLVRGSQASPWRRYNIVAYASMLVGAFGMFVFVSWYTGWMHAIRRYTHSLPPLDSAAVYSVPSLFHNWISPGYAAIQPAKRNDYVDDDRPARDLCTFAPSAVNRKEQRMYVPPLVQDRCIA